MASPFLQEKWKIWYHALDVNHDGKISMEDVEESRAKFTEMSHLEADKVKQVQENFTKWWLKFIFRGATEEISEEQFVKTFSADYEKDKDKFCKEIAACFDMIFDVIDTNKDRSISLDEYLIAFKAYGHENSPLIIKSFEMYGPNAEKLVPLRQVVDTWIDFVSGDDCSKPNCVKSAFDEGV